MVLDPPTTMLAAVLGLLGYTMIHVTYAVLGHRLRTQVRRHEIIVHARQRRRDYHAALAQKGATQKSDGPGAEIVGVDPVE